jgi:hypothetical protein
MMPPSYPISKQQHSYANYSQQEQGLSLEILYLTFNFSVRTGDVYGRNGVSQYPVSNPMMINPRSSALNTNAYRLPYQNEINPLSGTVTSHRQQISPKYSNSQQILNGPPLQSTWPSNSTTDSDLNSSNTSQQSTPYPYGTHPHLHVSPVQDDDRNSLTTKPIQSNLSKSPSCTSMSSYIPDDADSSNSSSSDSPSISNEKRKKTSNYRKTPIDVFNKLREMGDEHERNIFVDRLQNLWDEYHVICRNLPSISKQTVDLYRLYLCIREQNGFEQFSQIAKNRHWRDIALKLNIPNSSSAAFNIKQKYIHLKLLHYECKYDREGIDPEPILAKIEKQQRKRSKKLKQTVTNNDEYQPGTEQVHNNSEIDNQRGNYPLSQQSRSVGSYPTVASKTSQPSSMIPVPPNQPMIR